TQMSEVYFISRRAQPNNSFIDKIKKLIKKTDLKKNINKNDTVGIKLHFGEPGLTTFLRPVFLKPFTEEVKKSQGLPFLTDANTIYRGPRSDGVRHLETALKNGFSYTVTGAPIIIADGINSRNYAEVEIGKKYFDKVKIAGEAHRAKGLIVISHFKGHEMFGFGGAIKNIGMGLACKQGKLSLHSTAEPKVKKKKCTKCGTCQTWCPAGAIEIQQESAVIIPEKCIGCGQCIMACPYKAISLRWDVGFTEGQEKTAEYALGVVKPKRDKLWFFNFLMDITPECDCYGYSDSSLVPDIGVLASTDPVSIDQASYDMVVKASSMPDSKASGTKPGEDKFTKGHPKTQPEAILKYSEKIGLGQRKYNLKQIK
ncbi:MAG: DUF362 domain-containing protein, partial [Elusimicrobiota bacterium]